MGEIDVQYLNFGRNHQKWCLRWKCLLWAGGVRLVTAEAAVPGAVSRPSARGGRAGRRGGVPRAGALCTRSFRITDRQQRLKTVGADDSCERKLAERVNDRR
ncbi:hypothetical protein [Streptomyces sp. NPDC001914]|uniref:hypothetical protein n=1 Tax=Streptomyces sp. NPDC001914 TaxID=3364623 RepID=UPI00367D9BF7